MPTATLAQHIRGRGARLARRVRQDPIISHAAIEDALASPRWAEIETAFVAGQHALALASERGPLHRKLADRFTASATEIVWELIVWSATRHADVGVALFDDTGAKQDLGLPADLPGALRAAAHGIQRFGQYHGLPGLRLPEQRRRRLRLLLEDLGQDPRDLLRVERNLARDLRTLMRAAWDELGAPQAFPILEFDRGLLRVHQYFVAAWPRHAIRIALRDALDAQLTSRVIALHGIDAAGRAFHACEVQHDEKGHVVLDGAPMLPLHIALHELVHAAAGHEVREPSAAVDRELTALLRRRIGPGAEQHTALAMEAGPSLYHFGPGTLARLSEPSRHHDLRSMGFVVALGTLALYEALTDLASLELAQRLPRAVVGDLAFAPGDSRSAYGPAIAFLRELLPATTSALDLILRTGSLAFLRTALRARARTPEAIVAIEDEWFGRREVLVEPTSWPTMQRWIEWLDAEALDLASLPDGFDG